MEMRKEDRLATNIEAAARFPASPASVAILNLSKTGCLVSTESNLAKVGATILVSLTERIDVAGQIVWRDGDNCGVAFNQPMSKESIDWIARNAN